MEKKKKQISSRIMMQSFLIIMVSCMTTVAKKQSIQRVRISLQNIRNLCG